MYVNHHSNTLSYIFNYEPENYVISLSI